MAAAVAPPCNTYQGYLVRGIGMGGSIVVCVCASNAGSFLAARGLPPERRIAVGVGYIPLFAGASGVFSASVVMPQCTHTSIHSSIQRKIRRDAYFT